MVFGETLRYDSKHRRICFHAPSCSERAIHVVLEFSREKDYDRYFKAVWDRTKNGFKEVKICAFGEAEKMEPVISKNKFERCDHQRLIKIPIFREEQVLVWGRSTKKPEKS
jgi:hypothetical protein